MELFILSNYCVVITTRGVYFIFFFLPTTEEKFTKLVDILLQYFSSHKSLMIIFTSSKSFSFLTLSAASISSVFMLPAIPKLEDM